MSDIDLGGIPERTELLDLEGVPEQPDLLRQSWMQSKDRVPEQASQNAILAQKTKKTVRAVETNPQIATDDRYTEINTLLKDYPVSKTFLENPENMSQAHDDVENLSAVEELFKPITDYASDIGKSFGKGQDMVETSELGLKGMYQAFGAGDALTEKELVRLSELRESLGEDHSGDYGDISGAPIVAAEQLPIMGSILFEGAKFGAPAAAGGAGIGFAAGNMTGLGLFLPEELLTVPAGAMTLGVPAFKMGTAKGAFDLEAGLAFDEFSQMVDDDGNSLDPQVAAGAAAITGVFNAGLEYFSLSKLGKTFDGAKTVIRHKLRKQLMTETGRRAIARVVKNYGIAVGSEGGTEFLQEAMNAFMGEMAKTYDEGSFTDQDFSRAIDNFWSMETLERSGQAMKKGMQAAAVLSMPTSGASAYSQYNQSKKQSEVNVKKIDGLFQSTQASTLANNNKEAFREFVSQQSVNGEITEVFIPAEGATQLLHQSGLDPESPTYKAINLQIKEAVALGGDVVIPISDVMADVMTNADIMSSWQEWMRLSSDTSAPAEFTRANEIISEKAKRIARQAEESADGILAGQEVYNSTYEKLIATGEIPQHQARGNAAALQAFYETTAKNSGMSVEDFASRYNFTVQSGIQEGKMGGEVLGQNRKLDPLKDHISRRKMSEMTEEESVAEFEAQESHRGDREKQITDIINDDQGAAIFSNEAGTMMYSVTPAANGDEKYQVTVWDDKGAMSDSKHNSVEEIIRSYGYGNEFKKVASEEEFNALVSGGSVILAQQSGYQGADPVEASEWQKAVDKGLDMSYDARMERAYEQGYDPSRILYHGTSDDISEFDSGKLQSRDHGFIGQGTYMTSAPRVADFYANTAEAHERRDDGDFAEPNVMPLLAKTENTKVYDLSEKGDLSVEAHLSKGTNNEYSKALTDQLISEGYDSAAVIDASGAIIDLVVFDQSNIRSVNAAFDPDNADSSNLLAQSAQESQPSRNSLGLYSMVEKSVLEMNLPQWKNDGAANGKEIWSKIKKSSGVKAVELEWMGLEEFLNNGRPVNSEMTKQELKDAKKFTRSEVLAFVEANGFRVEENIGDQNPDEMSHSIDWESEIWSDSEAWEHNAEEMMYEFNNGDDDAIPSFSPQSWLVENIELVVENYEHSLSDDAKQELKDAVDESDILDVLQGAGYNVSEDMSGQMEGDARKAAKKAAEREYMDNPTYIYTAQGLIDDDTLLIFGNDDLGYDVRTSMNYRDVVRSEIYSLNEAKVQAEDHAREAEMIGSSDDVNATHVQGYVEEAEDDNYREVKIVMPNLDTSFYATEHYPDENIAAAMIVVDRELPAETVQVEVSIREWMDQFVLSVNDGRDDETFRTKEDAEAYKAELESKNIMMSGKEKNTYLLKEGQSDYASFIRKHGASTGSVVSDLENKADSLSDSTKDTVNDIWEEMGESPLDESYDSYSNYVHQDSNKETLHFQGGNVNAYDFTNIAFELLRGDMQHQYEGIDGRRFNLVRDILLAADKQTPPAGINEMIADVKEMDALHKQIKTERQGAPDMPYKGDAWIPLMMKRAILQAIDQGYESLAWSNAATLNERWSENYDYDSQYDKKMPSIVKKLTGQKPVNMSWDGEIIDPSEKSGRTIQKEIDALDAKVEKLIESVGSGASPDEIKDGTVKLDALHEKMDELKSALLDAGDDPHGYWVIPITDAVKEKIKKESTLFQKGQQENRAGVRFDQEEFATIMLARDSDASSFMHEASHMFLEIYADLASDPNVTGVVQQDFDALMKWFGTTREEWFAMPLNDRREMHEKFAESFERYLLEGKAPSPELVSVFNQFKNWLKEVYKKMSSVYGAALNDDIRAIFDRMLASDAQIAQAEQINSYEGLFTSAEDAGMTEAEFNSHEKNQEIASGKAEKTLLEKVMDPIRRQTEKWWKEEQDIVRLQVKTDLRQEKVYHAQEQLANAAVKLNKEDMKITLGIAEPKIPKSDNVQPEYDSILTAIAKLGGIDRDDAAAEGIDPANWKGKQGAASNMRLIGKPVFRMKKGKTMAGMAESLSEYGYIEFNANALLEKIELELAGAAQYAPQVDYNAIYPEQVENAYTVIPRNLYGLSKKDGGNNELAAASLGYNGANEMLRDIADSPSFNEAVETETDRRMTEKHGDVLHDGTIEALAEDAVHNDARAKVIWQELKALGRKTGRKLPYDIAVLKKQAELVISSKPLSKLRPEGYHRNEVKAAAQAAQAKEAGDNKKAEMFKEQQALNFYMYREARNAKAKAESHRKRLDQMKKAKYKTNQVDADYIQALKVYLSAIDTRSSPKEIDYEKIERVRAFVDAQVENNPDLIVGPVFDTITSWNDISLADLKGLVDAAENLLFTGKKNGNSEKAIFKEKTDLLAGNIVANTKKSKAGSHSKSTYMNIMRFREAFGAMHRKLESLIQQADGWVDNGVLSEAVFRPVWDAQVAEIDRMSKEHATLDGAFEGFDYMFNGLKHSLRDIESTRKYVDTHQIPVGQHGQTIALTRGERLVLALNWGNEGNRRALLEQEGRTMTEADILAAIGTLTKDELNLVNNLWAYVDSFYSELAETEKQATGLAPEKVQGSAFKVNGVDMKGGYYPLLGDSAVSWKDEVQEVEARAEKMKQGGSARASTKAGATIERKGFGGKAVNLSIDGLFKHVDSVVHDITHRMAVKEVDSIIRSKNVREALIHSLGKEGYQNIVNAVTRIAGGNIHPSDLAPVNKLFRWSRLATSYGAMGYSARTGLINITGLAPAVPEVGLKRLVAAVMKEMASPIETAKWVTGQSVFMEHRAQTIQRDVFDIMRNMQGNSTWNAVKANAFIFITKMDALVSRATWMAAYEKSLEGGATEEQAVYDADRTVTRTQGSGLKIDLSAVEDSSEVIRALSPMYTYFNAILNLLHRQTGKFKTGQTNINEFAQSLFFILVLPPILEEMMFGQNDDDDLDSEDIERYLRGFGSYFAGMWFGVRELSSYIKYGRMFESPFQKTVASIPKLAVEAGGIAFGDEEFDKQTIRAITNVAPLLGFPTGAQVNRTLGYLWELEQGNVYDPSLFDATFTGRVE